MYIPLLPSPASRILPCEQIHISSVSVQNPPVLLPPKSVCPPLSACTADGAARPLPASAGSKGITHTTFRGKSCANRDAARPYWKPRAKGAAPLWTPYIFSSPVHSAYIKRQSYFNLISLICFTFSENKKSHRLHLSWKNEICEIFIPLCQDVYCCSHR